MVVVSDELELLDESSVLAQEKMMVSEINEISNMYKIFFIFSSTPKAKYYCKDLGETNPPSNPILVLKYQIMLYIRLT